MRPIVIFSDSTCDLGEELIKKNDIKIVHLGVSFDKEEKIYKDGLDIDGEAIYKKVEAGSSLPTTSAPNISDYIEAFKVEIEKGNDIFYVGIGACLSSSLRNAQLAAEEFEKGRILTSDSQNLSTGAGLLVLKACKFRDEGCSLEEIKEKVDALVPLVSAKFCIDKLDYMNKGGRCSSFTKIIAHLLRMHPILKMINNKLVVYKMPRGKYKVALDAQINEFLEDYDNIDKDCVFITHSGRMDGDDQYVIEKIKPLVSEDALHVTVAGATISSHCGPKTLGILYILTKPRQTKK